MKRLNNDFEIDEREPIGIGITGEVFLGHESKTKEKIIAKKIKKYSI